jgi:hypothetical protein
MRPNQVRNNHINSPSGDMWIQVRTEATTMRTQINWEDHHWICREVTMKNSRHPTSSKSTYRPSCGLPVVERWEWVRSLVIHNSTPKPHVSSVYFPFASEELYSLPGVIHYAHTALSLTQAIFEWQKKQMLSQLWMRAV